MKNFTKPAMLLFIILIVFGCKEKEPYSPYDPTAYYMSAEINGNYIFEDIASSVYSPKDLEDYVRISGSDSRFSIRITFPVYCGEINFDLPSENPNVYLGINSTQCENGVLRITNYDMNLVQGTFSFDAYADSALEVRNGKFKLIHQYIEK